MAPRDQSGFSAARWRTGGRPDRYHAGRIATGEATIQEVGEQIFQMILEVASGPQTNLGRPLGPATMSLLCSILALSLR